MKFLAKGAFNDRSKTSFWSLWLKDFPGWIPRSGFQHELSVWGKKKKNPPNQKCEGFGSSSQQQPDLTYVN